MPSLDTSPLPQARLLADKVANADYARAQAQLAKVATAVQGAAEDGRTSVTLNGMLDEPVVKALRAKGYRVQHQSDQREGDYTYISFG